MDNISTMFQQKTEKSNVKGYTGKSFHYSWHSIRYREAELAFNLKKELILRIVQRYLWDVDSAFIPILQREMLSQSNGLKYEKI